MIKNIVLYCNKEPGKQIRGGGKGWRRQRDSGRVPAGGGQKAKVPHRYNIFVEKLSKGALLAAAAGGNNGLAHFTARQRQGHRLLQGGQSLCDGRHLGLTVVLCGQHLHTSSAVNSKNCMPSFNALRHHHRRRPRSAVELSCSISPQGKLQKPVRARENSL